MLAVTAVRAGEETPVPPTSPSGEASLGSPDTVCLPSGWPWPGALFRGDVRRTGRTPYAGPSQGNLAWTFETRGRIVADAAIDMDGNILVASLDGFLYSLTPEGKERWRYGAGAALWATPAIGPDGTIYLGTDKGTLVALSADGFEKWIFKIMGEPGERCMNDIDTSPIPTFQGTVYLTAGSRAYLIEGVGTVMGEADAGRKIFSSLALAGDGSLRFGSQGGGLWAAGSAMQTLWTLDTKAHSDATPVIDDAGNAYFGDDEGAVIKTDPAGSMLWKIALPGPVRAPLGLTRNGDVLVAASGERSALFAVSPEQGRVIWSHAIDWQPGSLHGISSGPLIDRDGNIFFGGRDGKLRALNPKGESYWSVFLGDDIDAGPVLTRAGLLVVGADNGRVYAFR